MPDETSPQVPRPTRPFVVLAGAGVSSAPPACLPGWWTLNDAILEVLFDRISGVDALTADQRAGVLADLKELRKQNRYPPDYQADFLEEEAGLDYFKGLQVLDVTEPNPFHGSVARMTARGDVAAIVTTNFDRLFEIALAAEGITSRVAYDTETFEQLQSAAAGEVLVIKVHGTVTLPESMIDTRKQRRRGRARALVECLARLFVAHPLVVAGFSGDDLDTNPDYLGLRSAGQTGTRLLWIAHPRTPPDPPLRDGAQGLLDSYPKGAAELVVADAADVFAAWSGAQPSTMNAESARHAAAQQLTERTTAWATGLDLPLAATMTAALLEAAGHRPIAHRVIRSGWNRGIEGSPGVPPASRQRFLRAHARVRFRRGRYDDPELGETLRLLFEIDDPLAGALNLFRNVMRSLPFDNLGRTVDLLANIELGEGGAPSDRVDAGLTCAYAGTVTDLGAECLDLLEQSRQLASSDGDDVREAMCGIEIALRLTKARREGDRAADLAKFATMVLKSIRDPRLESGIALCQAFGFAGLGRSQDAADFAASSFQLALADELRLQMARSALFWLRLAARENLDMTGPVQALRALNDQDLGPLAADANLGFAEWALRAHDPSGPERLAQVTDLAARRGLVWYADEVQRIGALR